MTSEALSRPWLRSRSRERAGSVRGPRVVPLLFFAVLAIALFFAMIYLRIALDRTAFELDTLEDSIELQESRQLDLRLQIAGLQDPLRISSEAQRIGLTHPQERVAIEVTGLRDTATPKTDDAPVAALSGIRDSGD